MDFGFVFRERGAGPGSVGIGERAEEDELIYKGETMKSSFAPCIGGLALFCKPNLPPAVYMHIIKNHGIYRHSLRPSPQKHNHHHPQAAAFAIASNNPPSQTL